MDCIIIEDQPPAQRILKKYVKDVPFLKLKGVFSNVLEVIEFLKQEKVDLIFLDIHLPKVSGMEFLKMLDNPPRIILTTAFSEYALESYEFNVVDYLLKPFSFERFMKAVNRVQLEEKKSEEIQILANENPEQEIFIKSGYEHIRLKINDIIFIKSDADYTELVTKAKKYLSSESLKYWKARFEKNNFLQIHKSYIINKSKIVKVASNQVYLENDERLPIGRSYKDDFMQNVVK